VGGQLQPAEASKMAALGGEPGADGEPCQHCRLGAHEVASGWPRNRCLRSIHGSSRSAPHVARRVFFTGVWGSAGGNPTGDADGAGGPNFAGGAGGRCETPRILHTEHHQLPHASSLPWPPYGAARMFSDTGRTWAGLVANISQPTAWSPRRRASPPPQPCIPC